MFSMKNLSRRSVLQFFAGSTLYTLFPEERGFALSSGKLWVEKSPVNAMEHLHAYFDTCPESPDGKRLLILEFQDTAPGLGTLIVGPTGEKDAWVRVGRQMYASAHEAASQQWINNQTVLAFGPGRDNSSQVIDIETGTVRILAGRVGSISPDGKLGAWTSNEATWDQRNRVRAGLSIVELRLGSILFQIEESRLTNMLPKAFLRPGERLWSKHAKWSPDGGQLMFVVTRVVEEQQRVKEVGNGKYLFVVDNDGLNIRLIGRIGHHPTWSRDSEHIIYGLRARTGNKLIKANIHTKAQSVALEKFDGVHASFSPVKDVIVADSYARSNGRWRVGLREYDLYTGTRRTFFEGEIPFFARNQRLHLHPAWSRSGEGVYFNYYCNGRRCVRYVSLIAESQD